MASFSLSECVRVCVCVCVCVHARMCACGYLCARPWCVGLCMYVDAEAPWDKARGLVTFQPVIPAVA